MENTTANSPDQEIMAYLKSAFTKEYQAELITTISLLYEMEYPDLQENILSMINGIEAEDPDTLSSKVALVIHEALDKMFTLWGFEIDDGAPLQVKNAIASALTLVLTVEDPVPYLRIIETDLSSVEKIARITEELTEVTEIAVLETVLAVTDACINRLYTKLLDKEERADEIAENHDRQLEHFQIFCKYVGTGHVAYEFMQHGFQLGMKIDTYFPYMSSFLDEGNVELTGKNILSYYLLGSDTWESPIEAFRKDSEILLKNPRDILLVETQMRSILEALEQYKRTLSESS